MKWQTEKFLFYPSSLGVSARNETGFNIIHRHTLPLFWTGYLQIWALKNGLQAEKLKPRIFLPTHSVHVITCSKDEWMNLWLLADTFLSTKEQYSVIRGFHCCTHTDSCGLLNITCHQLSKVHLFYINVPFRNLQCEDAST